MQVAPAWSALSARSRNLAWALDVAGKFEALLIM